VLDIGGGTGSWSIALAAADPNLTAMVFELADVARVAREHLRATAYSDRIDVHVGDILADDLPRGFDAFLLANLVHYFTPETNRSILQRVRAAAEPGARLLLADFWTDPTHTRPLAAALMAGEFAIHVDDGDVYSAEEGIAWLRETGWRYLDHRPLAGPMSVIVAETA
jgi:cyclopropane fatty-acyl-phospholipid synthase-like methyltransferase